MCGQHLELVNFKGPAEKLVETLGVVGGLGAGILAVLVLWLAWQPTEYDSIILKLFIGGCVGLGAFVMFWAVVALWLAPMFAEPASREARSAVQITHDWRRDGFVRLEFRNKALVDILQGKTGGDHEEDLLLKSRSFLYLSCAH